MKTGKLYLIPTLIGDESSLNQISSFTKEIIKKINYYIVENEKSARSFIKKICPKKNQDELIFFIINKKKYKSNTNYLKPCLEGHSTILMSDAGCPAIADPGSDIISLAHTNKLIIKPIPGPSSIILALMSSGMNGQNFSFNGYLPINKKERILKIKKIEKNSNLLSQSQIFIETPYRNNQLFNDLIRHLKPYTRLCIASNLTSKKEYINTMRIFEWKNIKIELNKKPTIFIIESLYN